MINPNDPERLKQIFLTMVKEVLDILYEEPLLSDNSISTKAISENGISVAWTIDRSKGAIQFRLERDGKVFIGEGNTAIEAFSNKQCVRQVT